MYSKTCSSFGQMPFPMRNDKAQRPNLTAQYQSTVCLQFIYVGVDMNIYRTQWWKTRPPHLSPAKTITFFKVNEEIRKQVKEPTCGCQVISNKT